MIVVVRLCLSFSQNRAIPKKQKKKQKKQKATKKKQRTKKNTFLRAKKRLLFQSKFVMLDSFAEYVLSLNVKKISTGLVE